MFLKQKICFVVLSVFLGVATSWEKQADLLGVQQVNNSSSPVLSESSVTCF